VGVLDQVAQRILDDERERVGIDGPDASGKTMFADRLATVLRGRGRPVLRVSVDDFHHARAIRHRRGRDSPEGFWAHAFNYERFLSDVVEPLDPGGSRRVRARAHDLATDAALNPEPVTVPAGAVIVVDGLFLHRDELRTVWDLTVFLDVPFTVTARRMARRDGTGDDPDGPDLRRYVEAQRIYYRACRPHDHATIVIDNTDPGTPRITRA
jgi:uridine kinase